MKFEAMVRKDIDQCVACIESGHLYIKTHEGTLLVPSDIAVNGDKLTYEPSHELFEYRVKTATERFYPGDKIVVTL